MQALLQQQLYDLYSRRSRIISKFLSPRATSCDRSRAIYLKCTSNFATRLLFFLPQLRRFDCTRDQRSLLASLFIHPLVSFAIAAFISLCASLFRISADSSSPFFRPPASCSFQLSHTRSFNLSFTNIVRATAHELLVIRIAHVFSSIFCISEFSRAPVSPSL